MVGDGSVLDPAGPPLADVPSGLAPSIEPGTNTRRPSCATRLSNDAMAPPPKPWLPMAVDIELMLDVMAMLLPEAMGYGDAPRTCAACVDGPGCGEALPRELALGWRPTWPIDTERRIVCRRLPLAWSL
jgi:hypothetical protein